MSASDLPFLNNELLDALDREVWYRAGQRSVVEFLKKHQERQKETMLNSTVLEGQI